MHSEISPHLGNDRVWEFTDLTDVMKRWSLGIQSEISPEEVSW